MSSGIEPRVLSKNAAAAYAGCESMSAFNDWVRRGILPGPIPGTTRWDRRAIDAALDRASGIIAPSDQISPYKRWKAEREGQAQGR